MKVNFFIEVLPWLVMADRLAFGRTGDTPLALEYPSLYDIVHIKEALVDSVLGANPLNIQFGGALIGDKWTVWNSFKV